MAQVKFRGRLEMRLLGDDCGSREQGMNRTPWFVGDIICTAPDMVRSAQTHACMQKVSSRIDAVLS
jgi:hypothetical protein